MAIRNFIHNHGVVVAVTSAAAVLVVVLAVTSLMSQGHGGDTAGAIYFDLVNNAIVLRDPATPSPDPASENRFSFPDGESGSVVRAYVYGCGDHGIKIKEGMTLDELSSQGGYLAWLERQPADYFVVMDRVKNGDQLNDRDHQKLREPPLVGTPGEDRWFHMLSREGKEITEKVNSLCAGSGPVLVAP